MALDDSQEAALKAELEAFKKELEDLKAVKKLEKDTADDNAGKKLPEESPEKKKIDKDYAKSMQELQNRIQALEEKLNVQPGSQGLRTVLKVS
jgi:hypothetical protein